MIHRMTTLILAIALVNVAVADWPQWRGPNRDGQIEGQPWPTSLDEKVLQKTWSLSMGPSYSGPIVVDNKVFVTETVDQTYESVRALDRYTGDQLWKVDWPGALKVPFFARENGSWIRSTPACDGEFLFVLGIRDVLVCLDVETGNEVWRFDFVNNLSTPLPSFGAVCSPLLDGDAVILQVGSATVKLNKATGELIWRSSQSRDSGMTSSPFSSPVIATLQGKRQLLVQSRADLMGIDSETGDKLWSVNVPAFRGMNILTPLVKGNSIITSSYGGGTFLFDVKSKNGKLEVEQRWKTTKQGYMSSPVLVDDFVFMHLRNQRLTCLDPENGKSKWTSTPFGKYWSMAANGNQILALDQRGELKLFRASPDEFKPLSSRKVSNTSTWAHIAVSDDQLFVREIDAISGWSWK